MTLPLCFRALRPPQTNDKHTRRIISSPQCIHSTTAAHKQQIMIITNRQVSLWWAGGSPSWWLDEESAVWWHEALAITNLCGTPGVERRRRLFSRETWGSAWWRARVSRGPQINKCWLNCERAAVWKCARKLEERDTALCEAAPRGSHQT